MHLKEFEEEIEQRLFKRLEFEKMTQEEKDEICKTYKENVNKFYLKEFLSLDFEDFVRGINCFNNCIFSKKLPNHFGHNTICISYHLFFEELSRRWNDVIEFRLSSIKCPNYKERIDE